jgi:3-dehydroquinate dehydratase I
MICVSLANIGLNRCVELLSKLECAEIRLDLMELTVEEVKQVFASPCVLVATCRPGKYPWEERAHLLIQAIRSGARYVDIEYEADDKLLHLIREHADDKGVKLIISYHNFDETPSYEELEEIIRISRLKGADIVKIACHAKNGHDSAVILSLYHKNKDIIAFCMGREGVITRVAAPLLGADFTFAAVDETFATAPGQLTFEKMEKIYHIMDIQK